MLFSTFAAMLFTFAQTPVPFTVCSQSDTWTRPTPEIQSKIWNDERYKGAGPTAREWTRYFIQNPPHSASISYHNTNVSGLWTAGTIKQCPRRDGEWQDWTEVWSIHHRVVAVAADGAVYTITVEPRGRGFTVFQFRRPAGSADTPITLRFVTPEGKLIDEIR